jgi:hypothetical protein
LITTIVVRTVNGSENGIGIGTVLPHVGHLHLYLLAGKDKGTGPHHRMGGQDVLLGGRVHLFQPYARGERKMSMVEEGVGIGMERGIEDMNIVDDLGIQCAGHIGRIYLSPT